MNKSNELCLLNVEIKKFLELLNIDRTISHARGSYLYTDKGEKLLDFTSQYGAVPFGHNPDFLWRTLIEQATLSQGIMIQPFQSAGAKALADKLVSIAPGKLAHVTFACSGAEAIETAIKMAKSRTKRICILSTLNSFHGKTMGASLATGNSYYREPFHAPDINFKYVPFNDLPELETALRNRHIAAFIVEPIQGEGGMVVPSPGYLKACEVLCNRYGTLLIVDEIQVGLGRTGTLFACEKEGVHPDILVIAKALGGGMLPISACIAKEEAWSAKFGHRHSATFANNHLSAVIGLRVIQYLNDDKSVLENIRKNGKYLADKLSLLVSLYPDAFDYTSGQGLMQGLALASWNDEDSYMAGFVCQLGYSVPMVSGYLLNQHQIFTLPTLNAKNVLRIQPSYLITKKEIDRLIYGLHDVGQLLSKGRFSEFIDSAIGLKKNKKLSIRMPHSTTKSKLMAPKGKKLGTFAFLIHPSCTLDVIDTMSGGLSAYNDDEIQRISSWLEQIKTLFSSAVPAFYIPCIPAKNGGYVDGWLISCLLEPAEMIRLSKSGKTKLLKSYISAAKSKNVNRVGLGAFTSVISRSGRTVADCGLSITTGNSYTALTGTDSLRQVCQFKGKKLTDMNFGIVGVSGSVGRLALLDLGPECARVYLIGNAKNKQKLDSLEVVAGELIHEVFCGTQSSVNRAIYWKLVVAGVTQDIVNFRQKNIDRDKHFQQVYLRVKKQFFTMGYSSDQFPIVLSNDIATQLPLCNIVITATSNGEAFIKPEMLGENAIVCDVARPSDLACEIKNTRQDVIAYEGGLVNLPADLRFGGANIIGLKTGVNLACFAETAILTMAQADGNHSIGGTSSLAEAQEIYELGMEFGFSTHIPVFENTDPVKSEKVVNCIVSLRQDSSTS